MVTYTRKRFDLGDFKRQTERTAGYFHERMKRFQKAFNDSDKDKRLASQECKECFYLAGKIGGAAMSESTCVVCGCDIRSGSTCVDYVCKKCAVAHNLCVACGGDLDMKTGRRKYPIAIAYTEAE